MITACWDIKLSVTRSAIHSRTTKNCRWAHLAKGEQIRCAVLKALILLGYNVQYVCKYLTDWMTLFIQVADIRRQRIRLTNRNVFKYCNGARIRIVAFAGSYIGSLRSLWGLIVYASMTRHPRGGAQKKVPLGVTSVGGSRLSRVGVRDITPLTFFKLKRP